MLHLKPVSIMWSLLARDLYLRNLISKTITPGHFLSLIYLNILICHWLSWQWLGSVPVVCIFVSHLTHLYARATVFPVHRYWDRRWNKGQKESGRGW